MLTTGQRVYDLCTQTERGECFVVGKDDDDRVAYLLATGNDNLITIMQRLFCMGFCL